MQTYKRTTKQSWPSFLYFLTCFDLPYYPNLQIESNWDYKEGWSASAFNSKFTWANQHEVGEYYDYIYVIYI